MTETENEGVEHKGRWTSELPRQTPTDSHPVIVSMAEADLRRTPPPVPPRCKPRGTGGDLPIGLIVDGLYEVDAKLGAGGMGEIYAATHRRLGKRVAIKVLGSQLSGDAAAIERFTAEARTLARIQHPAIVTVEHVGELVDGRTYFVMEHLRGESLFERLARGYVPLPEALCIIDQVARALEAAHACGVVHRDLKPDNVFLVYLPGEQTPIIKLLDFGLAKLVQLREHEEIRDEDDGERLARQTQSGIAAGTPRYMAPEQMRGGAVDHRADLYALGCIAYELLLDTPPFPNARTLPEFYAAHLRETPLLPQAVWPEVPSQIDEMLQGLLAKDPADRPTLAQTRSLIAAVRSEELPRTAKAAPAKQRSVKVQTLTLAIIVVALVALVAGVTIRSVVTARAAAGSQAASESAQPLPPQVTPRPLPSPLVWNVPAEFVLPTTAQSVPASAPQASTETASTASLSTEPTTSAKMVDTQAPAGDEHKPRKRPHALPKASAPAVVVPATNAIAEEPPPAPLATPPPEPEKTAIPIDRNQTMNPFAKKPKVNP